ncbi:hypothetical protein EHI8A_110920 [Entamoeba histolytica HM-1:IMSS-B]|uniref:Uncharacterized protein n=6 Tax=Entamoeba histolytica TaxID=5759 RepID=C4LWN0_ENTH1|nr:hypothetical protein EHI_069420 [Entamoeba histolytica HM-1:IMSS]EMD43851.1 myosin heavy chain clone, putative [Entamoeba histolytica KU27]EMH77065.1 hypothetical protein EHI8A_110920 [Entamoeba histolytica HM-1:IMSS-B]EMS16807.1 myosin heavy chain, clone, putative [Entamoeba histolytica HM-3:IMSS]ENY65971.1 myosin heavy chain, clone, putative [Entamoeba histolytica HM-1:IMSS-A]GAT93119.1 hypothetical protein CL6EHI_069420 [Entamoeba histolytica]|eukprot:XP_655287.1 hypothetical protein EHI_069420 [Entamoeba histolytica HM-1:IMSS]
MSTSEEGGKKKSGLSINMATAKREELIDFIHACSERIQASKKKIVELQVENKTQTEERELAEFRANDLERKIEAIRKVHNEQIEELTNKLDEIKEKLEQENPDINGIIDMLNGAMDNVEDDVEEKEDVVVKNMRNEETKRLIEANDMKWKTEMLDFKESLQIEQKKEIEKLKNQFEEEKKELENKLQREEKEREKLSFDLKNTNQLFSEYKTRTNKTFESGKEFRKQHENCDAEIFKLKAEIEKLKYENSRLKDDLEQAQK